MKKLTPTLFLLFLSLCIYGQSPEKMSYQAVIRDASNTLVTNQSIGMQISILQTTITGTTVYAETHTVTTNLNGLVSLEIGTGSTSDTFSTIDWSAGPYFIKTETDPTGGSSYTITGTSQLMSVPFAMYAKSSGNGITTDQSDAIVANTAKVGYADALVSANTAVAANTAKVGYTEAAVSANTDVAANTAKVGYTEAAVSANTDVAANTAKVGYTEALVSANTDVVANTAKTGITSDQSDAIVANTAKTGITSDQSDAIVANTAKTGITSDQSDAIVANTAKTGITSDQSDAIVANTAKTGITSDQADAIVANTAKTGITSDQADAIVANTAKTGITSDQSDAIVANTAKVGYTEALVSANTDVAANTLKVSYTQPIYSVNTFYAELGGYVIAVRDGGKHGLVVAMQDQGNSSWYEANDLLSDANNHDVNGAKFMDWRLPTKRELNLVYNQKSNIGGGFSYYWSSTEVDGYLAWSQYFYDGYQANSSKDSTRTVRAVRAF
jgi:hypothetical protein